MYPYLGYQQLGQVSKTDGYFNNVVKKIVEKGKSWLLDDENATRGGLQTPEVDADVADITEVIVGYFWKG